MRRHAHHLRAARLELLHRSALLVLNQRLDGEDENQRPGLDGVAAPILQQGLLVDHLRSAAQRSYQARARRLNGYLDTAANPGIYGAAYRYAMKKDLKKADSLLLYSDNIQNPKGDMFWMFPVIGTYLNGKDLMAPEVKAAVRNAWKTYAPYRGDTENHWAMYYASLYLAAEQWPNLPGSEWYNGKSSDENRNEAKEYLIHWIKVTTTIGQGEFDSPDYFQIGSAHV